MASSLDADKKKMRQILRIARRLELKDEEEVYVPLPAPRYFDPRLSLEMAAAYRPTGQIDEVFERLGICTGPDVQPDEWAKLSTMIQEDNVYDLLTPSRLLVMKDVWLNALIPPEYNQDKTLTPLMLSIASASIRCFDFLMALEANVNLSSPSENDITPLMLAFQHGNPKMIRKLVEAGAGLEARDSEGRTALFYGVNAGIEDLVLNLLSIFNVHPNYEEFDHEGKSVLWYAVSGPGDSRLVVHVLGRSARSCMTSVDTETGDNILHAYVRRLNKRTLDEDELIIERNVIKKILSIEPELTLSSNSSGFTPAQLARSLEMDGLAELLRY